VNACPQCRAAAEAPPGGWLIDDPNFVAHGVLGPSPIAGWVVIAPRRHVESLTELEPELQQQWFAIAARIDGVLRRELGATKVYLALFAEVVPHLHLHVIPRYRDTPAELRGPRCFSAPPAAAIPAAEVAAALARVRRALG
jgi:diadenosine tetraphosphate (Ap4A) HIT family hydrolase